MPIVTLPNGAFRVFPFSISAYDVAQDISPGLARNALGAGAELIEPLRWPVDAFWLVRSWILPRASRHEVLRCYPLADAAAGPAGSNPCPAHGLPDSLWPASPLGLR